MSAENWFHAKTVRAATPHVCEACSRVIDKGTLYRTATEKINGRYVNHKRCCSCASWTDDASTETPVKEPGFIGVSSVEAAQDEWVRQMNVAFAQHTARANRPSPIEEVLAGKASVIDDILRRD